MVTPVLRQMSWALIRVARSMWNPNAIDVCLWPLIKWVKAPITWSSCKKLRPLRELSSSLRGS